MHMHNEEMPSKENISPVRRYLQIDFVDVFLFIYFSFIYLFIYLFIGFPASAGRVHPSVFPSVRIFSQNWLISFFWNLA